MTPAGPRSYHSSSEPPTKGLESCYTQTGMIKRICEFAGAGRLQEQDNRSRISSVPSIVSPAFDVIQTLQGASRVREEEGGEEVM